MAIESKKPDSRTGTGIAVQRVYELFAPRAHTVIIFSALVFTLGAKFYHAYRYGMVQEYLTWIRADVSFLLIAELIMALVCLRWPRDSVMRICNVLATIITTWAVINAAWLVRNGTQVLPATLLPLIRDPVNNFPIVGVNLYKHPMTAISLLGPSFIMLAMVIRVIVRPVKPRYHLRFFWGRAVGTVILLTLTMPAHGTTMRQRASQPATSGLQFSSHIKAITSIIHPDSSPLTREDFKNATRTIPSYTQVHVSRPLPSQPPNLVVIVLEGIQYHYTSLEPGQSPLTPYLLELSQEGVTFTRMRSALTHTTKALFSLMTGRYPCASQDIVEALPVEGGYASLASILERQLGYRTAFLQSAKGNFESRPGLVRNLGFQTFMARENIQDPNAHLGYLAADEFAMLPLMHTWLEQETRPFFLTLLCSASHDPYIVPEWFRESAKEPIDRYQQIVEYTDQYLRAVDVELAQLGLRDNTILCVVGDHGEGFGEHGKLGHDRIGFEEVLRIPWVLRAPRGVQPGTRIETPVSSLDVTPTLLRLMGFEPAPDRFDGLDALGAIPVDRKVYFTGWAPEGAAGYLVGDTKYMHNPSVAELVMYDLAQDPGEVNSMDLPEDQAQAIIEALVHWRRQTIFQPRQVERGRMLLYDNWLCRWTRRSPVTKYQ